MSDPTVLAAQQKLNQLGMANPPLTEDGVIGPLTEQAISDYQSTDGLAVNGELDAPTRAALGLPPMAAGTKFDGTIANVRGISKLSVSDLQALVASANRIGVNPDWLATIMSFESGFSPSIKNAAGSGATGLIQFMPSTAAGLGTTTDSLASMSFQQQLPYVERYFAPYSGKMTSLEDTYLAVFYPAFIGKDNSTILGYSGSAIYDQNSGFDSGGKGYVTKSDITSTIRGILAAANGRIPVPGMAVASSGQSVGMTALEVVFGIAALGGAAYAAWRLLK